jgi:hypothetical protein
MLNLKQVTLYQSGAAKQLKIPVLNLVLVVTLLLSATWPSRDRSPRVLLELRSVRIPMRSGDAVDGPVSKD